MVRTRTVWPIVAHVGVGPVVLGVNEGALLDLLGAPSARRPRSSISGIEFPEGLFFFDNALQVSFDESGRVDFVGAASHMTIDVRYDDVPVFDVDADELAAYIAVDARVDEEDREFPTNWTFPNLELSLYRGCHPSDIPDSERGDDPSGLFWEQISVAKRGYFSKGKSLPAPDPQARPERPRCRRARDRSKPTR